MEKIYVADKVRPVYEEACSHQYLSQTPLGSVDISDGIVLPKQRGTFDGTGVLDADGKIVPYSERGFDGDCFKVPENTAVSDEEVIYGGVMFEHWGHFLTETTARLYHFLKKNPENRRIAFAAAHKKMPKVCRDFFRLLGVSEERMIFVCEPCRFKKIIVPEASFSLFKKEFSPLFLVPFDIVRAAVKPEKYEKIYLTKRKWAGLDFRCFGEKELEDVFKRNGYQIFSPEKLSLKKQIALIAGAAEIVTTNGTLAHNILFARDGVRLTVLNRSSGALVTQMQINEARRADYAFVDACREFLPVSHIHGPFLWAVTPELEAFLADRGMVLASERDPAAGFELFLHAWGDVYQKNREAYNILLRDENNDNDRALIERLADCFRPNRGLKKLFARIMFHLTCGRAKVFFKYRYKGASFVKTPENVQFVRELKRRSAGS